MGFLERLRQENEAYLQVKARQDAEERARLQAEEDARDLSYKRHEQASEVYHHNEFGMVCLSVILEELEALLKRPGTEYHYTGLLTDSHHSRLLMRDLPSVNLRDQDSYLKIILWDLKNPMTGRITTYTRKCMLIETCPDGTVVVHRDKGYSILSEAEWRNNKQALEGAFEKAFNSPLKTRPVRTIYHTIEHSEEIIL